MEDTVSWIFRGLELVKDLKTSLTNAPAQDSSALSQSLGEIARAFSTANEHLNRVLLLRGEHQRQGEEDSGMMEVNIAHRGNLHDEYLLRQLGGDRTPSKREGRGGDRAMEVADPGKGASSSSSSQRPRRRMGEEEEIETVLVPAPAMGNPEVPPDDNYTWRKYGQKEIYGRRFPRAYYRCNHQKLHNCPAKKQVQRLDDDPFTYQVTYRGRHTCHMAEASPQPMAAAAAGPSTSSSSSLMARYANQATEPQLVANMAEIMFNSASTSRNPGATIDLIFKTDRYGHEHPGDQDGKRN